MRSGKGSSTPRTTTRPEAFSGAFEAVTAPEAIFGQPLHEVLKRPDHEDFQVKIPIVVRHCCHTLYKQAFRQEQGGIIADGIFRISAQANVLQEVKSIYDELGYETHKEQSGAFSVLDLYDSHVAAGILKLYLREFDEPLMSFDSYRIVINAVKNNKPTEQIIRAVKGCIDRYLHTQDRILLNVILFLLWETHTLNANMKAQNLGIVFGQIFFQAPINFGDGDSENVAETMREIGYANKAVELMIANYQKLFSGKEKYIQKVYEPFYQERFLVESNEPETEILNALYDGADVQATPEQDQRVPNSTEEGNTRPFVEPTLDHPELIKKDFEQMIAQCNEESLKRQMEALWQRIMPYLKMKD
jgi:hypothetical protein